MTNPDFDPPPPSLTTTSGVVAVVVDLVLPTLVGMTLSFILYCLAFKKKNNLCFNCNGLLEIGRRPRGRGPKKETECGCPTSTGATRSAAAAAPLQRHLGDGGGSKSGSLRVAPRVALFLRHFNACSGLRTTLSLNACWQYWSGGHSLSLSLSLSLSPLPCIVYIPQTTVHTAQQVESLSSPFLSSVREFFIPWHLTAAAAAAAAVSQRRGEKGKNGNLGKKPHQMC